MTMLTTRQRNLLQLLLEADGPIGTADIAAQLKLTPRQVNYSLKSLDSWLALNSIALQSKPGVGIQLQGTFEQLRTLQSKLADSASFDLVLTGEQRQQLLALQLLTATDPLIVYQLHQMAQVSRTTILKDLDVVDSWLASTGCMLERRPNHGIWISGTEHARRQALALLLWGDDSWDAPLMQMTHAQGLSFPLATDANLLENVQQAANYVASLNTQRALVQVAQAEVRLGGRFTDDAVLVLALVLAIQAQRIDANHLLETTLAHSDWLEQHAIWPVAESIARRMETSMGHNWPTAEVTAITMYLLAAPRNNRWPRDLEVGTEFAELIDHLMQFISNRYQLPQLVHDTALRDGIVTQVVPDCLCQRFALRIPARQTDVLLSEKYTFEHNLAVDMAAEIHDITDCTLSAEEINRLAMLLRAAYIRERPAQVDRVFVVCPSGMATSQLLVARLKARFPRLGEPTVISVREMQKIAIDESMLILSTVPLRTIVSEGKVTQFIQVHPLLLPEDVERITQWLASSRRTQSVTE